VQPIINIPLIYMVLKNLDRY